MTWRAGLLVVAACGTSPVTPIDLDLTFPGGVLDPQSFTTVEVRVHGDDNIQRVVAVVDGQFDLGPIDPMTATSIEAVLRDDSGAVRGYGRVTAPIELASGTRISMPVRRPMVYAAGLISTDPDGNPTTTALHWTQAPATNVDLSAAGAIDGTRVVDTQVVEVVAAGPRLFAFHQATMDPSGSFVGSATIDEISMADHQVLATLPVSLDGGIADAAGSTDGHLLLVATSQALYAIDVDSGTLTTVAAGNFARVAMTTAADGSLAAIAIADRIADTGACMPTARLFAITGTGSFDVRELAQGGYADVAASDGRTFYVDACAGSLGEVVAGDVQIRALDLGRATSLAVAGTRAWIAVETPGATGTPAGLSLVTSSLEGAGPQVVFTHPAGQVVEANNYPGVQRTVVATEIHATGLELGDGGDFVAFSTASSYAGDAIAAANFPKMQISTDELWILDAASGAVERWYRSWCDGVLLISSGDIPAWRCATATGQSASDDPYQHRIRSLAVLFGLE